MPEDTEDPFSSHCDILPGQTDGAGGGGASSRLTQNGRKVTTWVCHRSQEGVLGAKGRERASGGQSPAVGRAGSSRGPSPGHVDVVLSVPHAVTLCACLCPDLIGTPVRLHQDHPSDLTLPYHLFRAPTSK